MIQILLVLLSSALFFACNNTGSAVDAAPAAKAKVKNPTSTKDSSDPCLLFANNSRDYANCQGCVTSLGTRDITRLAQCVHENTNIGGGGNCVGLVCGNGQFADFASCSCKDGSPPSVGGPSPGFDDTLSPFMVPGFFAGNRFCGIPTSTLSAAITLTDCLKSGGTTGGAGSTTTLAQFDVSPPANVFQDLGYLRWDLALDQSQFSPELPLSRSLQTRTTAGTISTNLSLYFQLKPNTELVSANKSTVKFSDCAEHFSGYTSAAGVPSLSSNHFCEARSPGSNRFPSTAFIRLTDSTGGDSVSTNGQAIIERASLNGTSSNFNITRLGNDGNVNVQMGGLAQQTTVGRQGVTAVWTGATGVPATANKMIIWGGKVKNQNGSHYFNDGAIYDPTTNTWTAIRASELTPRSGHTAVWDPNSLRMIIWGGKGPGCVNNAMGFCGDGASYNPATDTWTTLATTAAPSRRAYHTAIWDDVSNQMIIWGGQGVDASNKAENKADGATFSGAGAGAWAATGQGGALPSARAFHTAVWTGSTMIIWGGLGNNEENTGAIYNPLAGTWTATSTGANVPTARFLHTAVWDNTAGEMIIAGGTSKTAISPAGHGNQYSPGTDTWTAGVMGAFVPRYGHSAVFTQATGAPADATIVWGGCTTSPPTAADDLTCTTPLNSGNIAINAGAWATTEDTAPEEVPFERFGHAAVWDTLNNQMIIWGGEGTNGVAPPVGGRLSTIAVAAQAGTWTIDTTTIQPVSGLASNVGFYKYSFGPLGVQRPNPTTSSPTQIASNTTSGMIALNTNLGFQPISAVDSSAMSVDSTSATVASRTCSDASRPCILTAVYRSNGGNVMFQNFAPKFQNHATIASPLPGGIVAASTPKIIEDTSQICNADTTAGCLFDESKRPARVRVFVKATDGNIYMSRGERNQWSSWTSLGRPWIADSVSAALAFSTSSVPKVRRPYTNTFASNLPGRYLTPYSVSSPNNGLSISGEPVVVSFMDDRGFHDPIKGYIVILVRVSQLNSTNGLPGPYHNSVFYTYGVAGGTGSTASSRATTLDFDTLTNWSPWMPIIDTTTTPQGFHIQGNPLAMINDVVTPGTTLVAATPVLYVMGTELNTRASAGAANQFFVDPSTEPYKVNSWMHPPIAPDNGNANWLTLATYDPLLLFATKPWRGTWFNYGQVHVRTSLDLAAAGTPSSIANPLTTWRPFKKLDRGGITEQTLATTATDVTANGLGEAGTVYISDWTKSDINSSSSANTIRIYAHKLTGITKPTGAVGDLGTTYTGASTKIRSLGTYARQLQSFEFKFVGTGTDTSGMQFNPNNTAGTAIISCDYNTNINFLGNITPINISATASSFADPITSEKTLLIGRVVCPDPGVAATLGISCDRVNPTVAYAAVSNTSTTAACGTGITGSMYYSAGAVTPAATPLTTQRKLSNQFTTSDVMAYSSGALESSGNDVPIYLLLRNEAGKITHGVWGSANAGSGVPTFQFFTKGQTSN